jgi:hypothetical protein
MSSRFRLVTLASGMTHERVGGHVGELAPDRSPDLEIGLAETGEASPIPKLR